MQEQMPTVQFEPVRDSSGAGWNIRATLPDGRRPYVLGFESEAEARRWIELAAMPWLQRYLGGRYAAPSVRVGACQG